MSVGEYKTAYFGLLSSSIQSEIDRWAFAFTLRHALDCVIAMPDTITRVLTLGHDTLTIQFCTTWYTTPKKSLEMS